MKTNYNLADGGTITAGTPSEFLTELRKSSKFESDSSDAVFMVNFAERLKTYNGTDVRTDTPEHFMEDLVASGYATK